MDISTLVNAGLSEREAKAYIALIKSGVSTIGNIQKESKVPSSKIGETVNRLIKKNLVEVLLINKKKHYKAKNPELILQKFDSEREELKKTVNDLQSLSQVKQAKEYVELYQGFPAIRELFRSLLDKADKGEDWLGFTSGESQSIEKAWKFYEFLGRIREEKGIKNKLLIPSKIKEWYNQRLKKSFVEIRKEHKGTIKYNDLFRYVDIQFPGDVAMFRENVILLDLTSKLASAILISGKNLSEKYKNFFWKAWEKSKQ